MFGEVQVIIEELIAILRRKPADTTFVQCSVRII